MFKNVKDREGSLILRLFIYGNSRVTNGLREIKRSKPETETDASVDKWIPSTLLRLAGSIRGHLLFGYMSLKLFSSKIKRLSGFRYKDPICLGRPQSYRSLQQLRSRGTGPVRSTYRPGHATLWHLARSKKTGRIS